MSNGHAGLPVDLPSELMDTDPFDIGLDHNEPAPEENRKETAYEEIMGIDGDANKGGGPKALGDRLVAFRKWLSKDAQVTVHPHVCIVNGLATDGTKNAPVLVTAAALTSTTTTTSTKDSTTEASGRCGMVDGEMDRALYDRTMGCQIRASREIRCNEVLLTVPRSAMITPDLVACSDAGRAVMACIEPASDGNIADYWDALENTGISEKRHADRVGMTNGTNLLVKILQERKKAETAAAKSVEQLEEKRTQTSSYQVRGRRKLSLPYKLAPQKVVSTRAPVLAFLIQQRFTNDVSPAVIGDSLETREEIDENDLRNALSGSKQIIQPPGSPSTFAPYARTLPSAVSLPICWKRNELALLAGCIPGLAPLQEVAATTLQLASEFVALVEAGILHRFPSVFSRDLITWERWVWAASVFASRILPSTLFLNKGEPNAHDHVPSDPQLFQSASHIWDELGVMVPLMDMCNHEIEAAQVTWEPCIPVNLENTGNEPHPPRAIAHKKIKKGAQIYTNYGLKSNQDLICSYGFGQMNNESDNVKLGWGLADGIGNSGVPIDYTDPVSANEIASTPKCDKDFEPNISGAHLFSVSDLIFESTDNEKVNMWWTHKRLTILECEAMIPSPVFESLRSGKKMVTAAFGDGSYDPLLLSSVVVATLSSAKVRSYQKSTDKNAPGLLLTRKHQAVIRKYLIYFFSRKMEKLLENLNNGLKAHYTNVNLWTKSICGGLYHSSSQYPQPDGVSFMGWQTFFDSHAYSMSMEVEKRYYSMGTDSCVLTFYDGQLRALQSAIDGISTWEKFECNVLKQLKDLEYVVMTEEDEASLPTDTIIKGENDDYGVSHDDEKVNELVCESGEKKDKSKAVKKRKKRSGGGGVGADRPPALKLHIGNLAYTTVTADLFDYFANLYGRQNILECHIPTERGTERSRGFGFVTLPENIAMEIVQSGRKYDLNGRLLKIAESNSAGAANRKGIVIGGSGVGGGSGISGGPHVSIITAISNDRCARCGYRPKYCICPIPDLPGFNGRSRHLDEKRPLNHGDPHIRDPELDYYGASHKRVRDSGSLSPSHRGRDRDYDRYDRDHRHHRSRSYSRGRESRERRRESRERRREHGRSRERSRDRSWDHDRRSRSIRDREGRRGSRYSRSLSSNESRSYSGSRPSRRDRRIPDANGDTRVRNRDPSHSVSPANRSKIGAVAERSRSRSKDRERARSSRRKRNKKEGRKRAARSRSPGGSPAQNANDE